VRREFPPPPPFPLAGTGQVRYQMGATTCQTHTLTSSTYFGRSHLLMGITKAFESPHLLEHLEGICGLVGVHGAWCMMHGVWCMVHGAWCMVHGAWCMVHGAWCMVYKGFPAPPHTSRCP
jgi:hypothetical protein